MLMSWLQWLYVDSWGTPMALAYQTDVCLRHRERVYSSYIYSLVSKYTSEPLLVAPSAVCFMCLVDSALTTL